MQSVARRTSGSNAAFFWRTDSCIQAAGLAEGVAISSETFITSDNPNSDWRIIPWAPRIRVCNAGIAARVALHAILKSRAPEWRRGGVRVTLEHGRARPERNE